MTYQKSRRLRPSAENRQIAVDQIIHGLREYELEFDTERYKQNLWAHVQSTEFEAPEYFMFRHAFELGIKGTNLILEGNQNGWHYFSLAANYARWGQVNDRCARRREGSSLKDPMANADVCAFYSLFAIAFCPETVSRPWANYLNNLFSNGGVKHDIGDEPMFNFLSFVFQSYCNNAWNATLASEDLEDFAPLVKTVGTTSWTEALTSFCDYRLSRAYEFPNSFATKAHPSSGFFFTRQWFAIYPLEIIALARMYESLNGGKIDLNCSHPILQTNLMEFSPCAELPTDDLLLELNARSMKFYGGEWQAN